MAIVSGEDARNSATMSLMRPDDTVLGTKCLTKTTTTMTDLTFAIGDVHGRLDLLRTAFAAISSRALGKSYRVIMLGDYIDRGPESKAVIEFLRSMEGLQWLICLKGNHEKMMIDAFYHRAKSTVKFWLNNGGEETAESYGADIGWGKPSFWPLIPTEHIKWMEGLPVVVEHDERVFVHAGFMPGFPLEDQTEENMLWIRDRFLRAESDFMDWPYIVHGHTPQWTGNVDVRSWRCNLDSAAYETNVLSVGVFEGSGGPPIEIIRAGAVSWDVTKPAMLA